VVPNFWLCAGNRNNKLLPAPAPIMTKIELSFLIMAFNAGFAIPGIWPARPTSASAPHQCQSLSIASIVPVEPPACHHLPLASSCILPPAYHELTQIEKPCAYLPKLLLLADDRIAPFHQFTGIYCGGYSGFACTALSFIIKRIVVRILLLLFSSDIYHLVYRESLRIYLFHSSQCYYYYGFEFYSQPLSPTPSLQPIYSVFVLHTPTMVRYDGKSYDFPLQYHAGNVGTMTTL